MGAILVVDDNRDLCAAMEKVLSRAGHCVVTVGEGAKALDELEKHDYDLLITDLRIPDMNGLEVLKQVRRRSPTTPAMIMTAYGTIESAVEAMRMGAQDYVVKPFSIEELEIRIARVLEGQRLRLENEMLKESLFQRFGPMIGSGQAMQRVYKLIEKVAPTLAPVLVTGESGTGKELVAREIHARSERSNGPFVAVNCVALASGVLESELFGHEKGAFTGAASRRRGKFEIADSGTLFLDEVGELSDTTQVKLLRFLQEKEFQRVGGNDNIHVDVRVIAATNQDLQKRIESGLFREDLFYRLNVFSIEMPPLKDRGDDLYELIEHFLAKYNREFNRKASVTARVLHVLKHHTWPGNVRELENAIAQAIILAEGDRIEPQHLPYVLAAADEEISQRELDDVATGNLNERMAAIEAEIIRAALRDAEGNQSRAAKDLGIKRTSLQYKMNKYGIGGRPNANRREH